ncbi:MAG TPA: DNA polymerase Y family protein [Sphingomicrobium sp.]|nr:DNA polymerase Y family protein [Sphingomicrobium sp.]
MTGRVLSIWLPRLAIERWAKSSDCAPELPTVLTVEGTHGPVLYSVTKAAAGLGARTGARLTDARALAPDLVAIPADPQGDEALLQRLARWAQRWSPLVEIDGADSLRLEVTGVAHLFGGEEALSAQVRGRFEALELTARVAIAPTAAAAWALARCAPGICGRDELESRLSPLPVSALRLEPGTVRTLERLGLKTIGALSRLPRLSLARRFRGAEDVVDALDRALGKTAEPLTAARDDPPPRAGLRLGEPATHVEAASQALERLIPALVRELERRRLGARNLSLHGFRVDGSLAVASVAIAIPSRDPEHLARLLAGAMETAALDPGFGFDAFVLAADWAESLDAAQENLVEEPSGERDLARLVDRLSVKLGPKAVRRPQPRESHVPERSFEWVAATSSLQAKRGNPDLASVLAASRPPRLLDRPEAIAVVYATPQGVPRRFVWRRVVHDIALVEGPERIAPEWWRERSTARLRDYYRVEDEAGRRYWIFREGLAGDGRGGAPDWFMHGLFG